MHDYSQAPFPPGLILRIHYPQPPVYPTVRLVKLAETPDLESPAAEWESYVPGEPGEGTAPLPVNYELEGELTAPIVVGRQICILRRIRCGVAVGGLFLSSEVVLIEEGMVATLNSVYRIEYLA